MIRILLTGKDGQVGWELQRSLQCLGDVVAIGREQCDLADADGLRGLVRSTRPDLVINTAAFTAVDKAESEPGFALAINTQAPSILAEEAHALGAALIHFSTDYVFDGRKPTPYDESDTPNPLSVYGRTKLEGEQAIAASGAAHLILRTSWVYAARGRNFLLTILKLARERQTLRIVDDQVGAPTWARTIAEATATLIARAGRDREALLSSFGQRGGVLNLTASGSTSWHGLATRVLELAPDPKRMVREVLPIPSAQYPTPAARPANSRLGLDRLERDWGVRMPEWDTALGWCLADPRGD